MNARKRQRLIDSADYFLRILSKDNRKDTKRAAELIMRERNRLELPIKGSVAS